MTHINNPIYQVEVVNAKTLVVHCGDPRFQKAFRNFITNELDIPAYSPIVLGGGAHAFGVVQEMPENYNVLEMQIGFFIEVLGFKQILLFNHQDCIWYEKMHKFYPDESLLEKGKKDLVTAVQLLEGKYPDLKVRSFWTALDGDTISFQEIT